MFRIYCKLRRFLIITNYSKKINKFMGQFKFLPMQPLVFLPIILISIVYLELIFFTFYFFYYLLNKSLVLKREQNDLLRELISKLDNKWCIEGDEKFLFQINICVGFRPFISFIKKESWKLAKHPANHLFEHCCSSSVLEIYSETYPVKNVRWLKSKLVLSEVIG